MSISRVVSDSFMNKGKLFFIYIAKESEWKDRESQDWTLRSIHGAFFQLVDKKEFQY